MSFLSALQAPDEHERGTAISTSSGPRPRAAGGDAAGGAVAAEPRTRERLSGRSPRSPCSVQRSASGVWMAQRPSCSAVLSIAASITRPAIGSCSGFDRVSRPDDDDDEGRSVGAFFQKSAGALPFVCKWLLSTSFPLGIFNSSPSVLPSLEYHQAGNGRLASSSNRL